MISGFGKTFFFTLVRKIINNKKKKVFLTGFKIKINFDSNTNHTLGIVYNE